MFNSKKIKKLEAEVCLLRQKLTEYSNLSQLALENRDAIREIANKVDPKPSKVVTYTVDAVQLAKHLQRFRQRRKCGGGGCGTYYEIPSKEIDSVASKTVEPKEIENEKLK